MAVAACAFAAVEALADQPGWVPVALTLPFVLFAGVALHECGHALAAAAFRQRVIGIDVCVGPRVRFTLGRTELRIGLVPGLLGTTWTYARRPVAAFVVVAAGPTTSLAIAGLAWRVGGPVPTAIAVVNAWIGIVSLLPSEASGLPSDGLQLVRILRAVPARTPRVPARAHLRSFGLTSAIDPGTVLDVARRRVAECRDVEALHLLDRLHPGRLSEADRALVAALRAAASESREARRAQWQQRLGTADDVRSAPA